MGADSLILEKASFQKGLDVQESKLKVTEVASLEKNGGKSIR